MQADATLVVPKWLYFIKIAIIIFNIISIVVIIIITVISITLLVLFHFISKVKAIAI